MMKWLRCRSIIRAEVVLVVWLAVGGLAWADTLDLSDDLVLPLVGIQLAVEPDPLDDFREILNPVLLDSAAGGLVPETPLSPPRHLPPFSGTLLHLSALPLYQVFCVYRV
ncbi:MAG TPA: hypothetical protein VEI50_00835 [Nitrospiraceae bacterium]|nr:hypothetical protein [Nitrospiraceae bacterium]